jgi:hypothetical protein
MWDSIEFILMVVFTPCMQVWPEVKSGAVQHSPTNKEPPKHGPWSPVSCYIYYVHVRYTGI